MYKLKGQGQERDVLNPEMGQEGPSEETALQPLH